jgi:hypothetical protein
VIRSADLSKVPQLARNSKSLKFDSTLVSISYIINQLRVAKIGKVINQSSYY